MHNSFADMDEIVAFDVRLEMTLSVPLRNLLVLRQVTFSNKNKNKKTKGSLPISFQ
jgi:hypothetical protein